MPGAGQRGLDAGDVDDLAAPARDHVARDGLTDMKDRRDVGLQQPFERVGGKLFQRAAMLHSCVVDQNVDGAARGFERVHRGAHARMVGRIESQRFGARHLCRRCRQFARVARVSTTCAPAAASPCASASAMPCDDPVISARFPDRSNS